MGQAPGRLEQSGASMIAVHGRTRSQRHSGLADWDQIGAVRAALSIPVVANGNIQNDRDVDDCMAATGCVGCMSAYGLLKNPAMFSPSLQLTDFELVSHYLDFCEEYPPAETRVMADHLLVLLEDVLSSDTGLNDSMVDVVQSLRRPGWYEDVGVDGLRQLVQMVQQRELGNASRISLNTIKARALGCNSREVEHAATKQDNDRARRNAKQLRRRHRDALAGAWNAGATARAVRGVVAKLQLRVQEHGIRAAAMASAWRVVRGAAVTALLQLVVAFTEEHYFEQGWEQVSKGRGRSYKESSKRRGRGRSSRDEGKESCKDNNKARSSKGKESCKGKERNCKGKGRSYKGKECCNDQLQHLLRELHQQ